MSWDSTCVDTYASYIVQKSANQAGAAAQGAENRKQRRYEELGRRFKFQPVAVETCGSLGQSTLPFLKELGRRISCETGDKREVEFLFQRVSLAVVRGNATSLLMGPTTIAAPVEGNERGILPELTLAPAYPSTDPARSAERTCEKDASLQLDSVGWRQPEGRNQRTQEHA